MNQPKKPLPPIPTSRREVEDVLLGVPDNRQIRLKCLEAAVRTVAPSNDGSIVMRLAADYYAFVVEKAVGSGQ